MESRTRILISVISSLAVSLVIALTAFSILKGMNTELRQGPLYDDIIEKTQALSILTASFNQGSRQSDVSQVKGILLSLDNLLKKITSQVPGEEVLVRHLQRNNRELGPLIDQLLFSGREMTDDLERERRNILISQVWMKVRFITDDTNRLRIMSQARLIAAQEKAGAVVIALIIILALTNGGIYFLSGRSIMRTQKALRESEERLRFALDTCHIGAWDIDLVDHTAYRSLEHDRIFGYTELLPEWTLDMFLKHALPEYRAEVETMVREATSAQTGWTHECRIRRADGEIRWIWFTGRYFTDISGRSRVAGVVQDITERKQAEEALRESEEQFRTLADAIPQLCWMANADGWIFWYNQRWYEYTGTTAEQMEGWGWQSVHDPDVLPDVVERWQASIASGEPFDMSSPLRGKDGVFRSFLTRVLPLKDSSGRVQRWFGTCTDIEEFKQAALALEESEAKYRELFEASPVAIHLAEVICDAEGRPNDYRFLDVNPAFERFTRMKATDLVGRTVLEAVPRSDRAVVERQGWVALTGVPDHFEGSSVAFNLHWEATVFSPRQGQCVTQIVDITERKQAEEALRESENKFSILFNKASLPAVLSRFPDHVFVDVNDAWTQLFGYTKEESTGKTSLELGVNRDAERRGRTIDEVRGHRQVRDLEQTLYSKTGDALTILTNVNVITIGGQEYALTSMQDITERKRAEAKIIAYQEQLRSMASELSFVEERERHKIATALHDQIGQTLALAAIKLGELRQAVSSGNLGGQVDGIREMITRAIHYSRTLTFELSPPILYELGLEAAVGSLAERFQKEHGIRIVCSDDHRPKPLSDEIRVLLFQGVRELLVNAVKHARPRRITISSWREGAEIRVMVEDDGVGFTTADGENMTGKNYGFGLFSLRERLKYLGGSIAIESAPGHGTRVTLTAPLLTEPGPDK